MIFPFPVLALCQILCTSQFPPTEYNSAVHPTALTEPLVTKSFFKGDSLGKQPNSHNTMQLQFNGEILFNGLSMINIK